MTVSASSPRMSRIIISVIVIVMTAIAVFLSLSRSKTIDLNILYIEDSKAPKLSDEDIEAIQKYLISKSRELLEVKIKKIRVTKKPLDETGDLLSDGQISSRTYDQRDFYSRFVYKTVQAYLPNDYDPNELAESVTHQIEALSMERRLEFVPDPFKAEVKKTGKVPRAVVQDICTSAIKKYKALLSLKDAAGNQIIRGGYKIINWYNFVEGVQDYDLVLFNGLFIEDLKNLDAGFMSLHPFVRGGVSFGFSLHSPGKYHGICGVATMPILSDDPPFTDWRYPPLSKDEKHMAIAIVICHELGHLLFDYRDEYGHERCVMRPAVGYNFKETVSKTLKCEQSHLRNGYFRDPIFAKTEK